MRGFKLDPITHDLVIEGGLFVELDGDEATSQEIKTRLLFFKGESFTNIFEGVPYISEIIRKGFDENRARSIVRQTILSVPAIVDVESVEFRLDRLTRALTVTWSARTNTGTVISSEDFAPLIIEETQ